MRVTQEEFPTVCPHLGLADDADSHATYATEAHRCYCLDNPTRIATPHQETFCLGANHVTCPVYLGEGVPGASRRTQPQATAGAAPAPTATVRGPKGGREGGSQRAFSGGGRATAPAGGPKPARRAGSSEPLGPRPRSGGVSMPVATIGLFALALVVVGLAIAINQLVGDSGGGSQAPADAVATKDALNKTQTAQAGGNGQTPTTPTTPTTKTPGTGQTPGTATTGTPATTATGTRTPGTGTPTSGSKTYTVKSGDFCGTIAEANGITLDALLKANNMTEADCATLQIGQVLKLP